MITAYTYETPPFPLFKPGKGNSLSFKTAYKSYTWGCFFLKHNIKPRNPNDFLCKICLSFSDDPHHLFFHCPFTPKLISDLEPLLTAVLKNLLPLHKALFFLTTPTQSVHHISLHLN